MCGAGGHFQRGSENTNSVQPECKLLSCFTVDDGKNICGAKKGLVGQICKTSENTNPLMWMVSCFVIQQQGLCKKHWDLSCVIEPVESAVTLIWTSPLLLSWVFVRRKTEYPNFPNHIAIQ